MRLIITSEKYKKTGEKGITLIALIVTIIVLLILAGISIMMLTGQNGILKRAIEAKEADVKGTAKEEIDLAIVNSSDEFGDINEDKLQKELDNIEATVKSKGEVWDVEHKGYDFKINVGEESKETSRDSGLYQNGVQIYNWQELLDAGLVTVENNILTGTNSKDENFKGDLVIDETITGLKTEAIYNTDKITSIAIKSSTTDLEDGAICYNEGLKAIYIAKGHPTLKDIKGIVYSKSGKTIIQVPREWEGDFNSTLRGVTTIGTCAFYDNENIKEIYIPKNINKMCERAFRESNIEKIEISDSVTDFQSSIFYECKRLSDVTLPSGLTEIPNSTFFQCNNLKNVNIPPNVTKIGNLAFFECSVTLLNLSSSIHQVGEFAFYGNNGMISGLKGLGWVGDQAFGDCGITETLKGRALSINPRACLVGGGWAMSGQDICKYKEQ